MGQRCEVLGPKEHLLCTNDFYGLSLNLTDLLPKGKLKCKVHFPVAVQSWDKDSSRLSTFENKLFRKMTQRVLYCSKKEIHLKKTGQAFITQNLKLRSMLDYIGYALGIEKHA